MTNFTRSRFEFTFEGEDEIEVDTLIAGLQSLNTLVVATQKSCIANTECNLKVVAHKQGSFIAELMIVAQTINNLITPDNINYASNFASLIVSFFDLKIHIGNYLPKSLNKNKNLLDVENSKGEVKQFPIITEEYFKNAKIENSIIQIINSADQNASISGLKIQTEDFQSTAIPRSEFSRVSEKVVDKIDFPTTEIKSRDIIFVRQPVCFGDSRWEFQKDQRFYAKILDKEWMQAYREGKHPIVPGIQLVVEMKSYVRLDDDGMPMEGKTVYEIEKVINTIYPEAIDQTNLFK